jgi:hypothetical protein
VFLVLVGFMLFGAGMRALAVAKTHGSLSIGEMSVAALLALCSKRRGSVAKGEAI